ncbi:MAG: hypothetical protein ACPGO5_02245 [Patescibacteria group bacterium]
MDNTETPQEIHDLREEYRAKIFRMMLYIAIIFGVPAVAAFWIGGALDLRFETGGNTYRLILLGCAFVLSWVWVARMYVRLNKESKEIEQKAREAKAKQETPDN